MMPIRTTSPNTVTRVACTMLALELTLLPFAVEAQGLTDSIAASFKEQGDRAIDAGDYVAAVEAYDKGNRISHHPVFDFNLARALQGVGRMAEALDLLERFDREASPELRAQVSGYDELFAQLRRSVAELILEGERRDARVRVNGRDFGNLEPGKRIRCDAGSLELLVQAEGYQSISRRVAITVGETRTVQLKWVHIDDRARIRLSASTSATRVWVDEHFVGQTPIELKLTPGKHRLRLEHPDSLPLQTEIVTASRESREITLDMPRPAPIWSRWWFWTGAAAVATGLVIAGIALSTSKSARPGDIEPRVVSGPLVAP